MSAASSAQGTITRSLIDRMPAGFTLPDALIQTFDWIEGQGWLHPADPTHDAKEWLSIYPRDLAMQHNASQVVIGGTALPFTGHWSAPDAAIDARVFEFLGTSGDGARAGLWLDDAGVQHFVHIGHDTVGVISEDPLVLLQWLAMGYGEPGAMQATDITPLQQLMDFNGVTDATLFTPQDLPLIPTDLQTYLHATFGVTPPATARDLGIADFSLFGETSTTDPFARWMIDILPPPTPEELAMIAEMEKRAQDIMQSMGLEDTDTPQDP